MREVITKFGLIAFDGQVIELFGFGEQGSRRFHVHWIEGISWDGSILRIDVPAAGVGLASMMRLDETEHAALIGLVDDVLRARA